MYEVSAELYHEAAMRLEDEIDRGNYYSGTFTFRYGEMECRFVTSVIVYRERVDAPDFTGRPITNLVPVWWEFHTVAAGGEVLNDFDFSEMKRYI